MGKKTLILVPSSHWDREWYLSYRRTQLRLVRLFNKILHLTENDGYSFLLDGQTIMLEDYLEIYPEHEELLKERVRAGKIVPGPWYTVPDTAIPCGEGLVRNLQLGQTLCQRFGGGNKTAYTPDTFGQASQMPQIYKLFGFDRAMFTRGVWNGKPGADPKLLTWSGADGTKLTTLNASYCEALMLTVNDIWKSFDKETVTYETCKEHFQQLLQHQEQSWKSNVRLGIIGIDHMEPIRELPSYVKRLQEDFPEYDLRLGTMDEFFDLLEKEVEQNPELLIPVHGEQRGDPALIFPLANTLSTRMDLKDLLREAENCLQYLCEPLAAFCPVTDDFSDVETGNYCNQAWRLLAACQAHDSICMCNTDQTNRDVANRLEQANQMANEAKKILQQRLGEQIAPLCVCTELNTTQHDITSAAALVVYNPLPFTRSAHIKGKTLIPCYTPGIKLVMADGTEVSDAVIRETFRRRRDIESMKLNEYDEILKDNTRVPLAHMDEYDWHIGIEYEFDAENIPACGWRAYYLVAEPCGTDVRESTAKVTADMASVPLSMYMDGDVLIFAKDGNIICKVHFEDDTDLGDSYTFTPGGDCRVMPAFGEAAVTFLHGQQVLEQSFVLQRADGVVRLQMTVRISKGSDKPEFCFKVENEAVGHRLRMIVTTTDSCTESFGDSAFDLSRRPVFTETQNPMHVRTRPLRNIAGIQGNQVLAIFSSGMREYEAALTKNGTCLALTILRSTAKVYSTGLPNRPEGGAADFVRWHTEDSCMIGTYGTRCALAVYPNEISDLNLHNDALAWQIPLQVFGTWAHGTAPAEGSFLEVNGAILSAVQEKKHGMLLRLFVDKDGGICTVDCRKIIASTRLLDLTGRPLSEKTAARSIQIQGSKAIFELKSGQIATLEIQFA